MQAMSKCNKFIPQAFNNNKCQTCFVYKDNHTPEALLEYSKSTRKIIKYGYLFIAPPELDLNKTKRWQWRFFILYDDGELTYSLDDNPLTLPQGKIYVDKCQEVLDATSLTGYPNSLKLAFFEHAAFIAGSGLDDIVKWKETLNSIIERQRNFKTTKRYQPFNTIEKLEKKIDYEKSIDGKSCNGNSNNSNKQVIYSNNSLMSKSDSSLKDSNKKKNKMSNSSNANATTATSSQQINNKNDEIEVIDADVEDIDVEEDYDDIEDEIHAVDSDIDEDEEDEEDDDDEDDDLIMSSKHDHQKRRYSYKEDDLVRKQRLKENLNQLLIEYKHEEEEQMRKLSKYTTPPKSEANSKLNNRSSLDSAKANRALNSIQPLLVNNTTTAKSVATLSTATTNDASKQKKQINSAFKPIVPTSTPTASITNNNTAQSSNKPSKMSKTHVSNTNKNDDSASYSSTSSSSSSWSSSSSSNSPPKLRSLTTPATSTASPTTTVTSASSNLAVYKKPCLISPRKDGLTEQAPQAATPQDAYQLLSCASYASSASSNNSAKSLTIVLRNNSIDENSTSSASNKSTITQPQQQLYDDVFDDHENMEMIRTGYLWKLKESKKNWDKFWFSLNNSNLLYWNEKIEQDLSKPIAGKFELFKCAQVKEIITNEYDSYAFQLTIHNTASTTFKAITSDVRNNWIQAIRQAIEQTTVVCLKCKPKLVVNPLVTKSSGLNDTISTTSITKSLTNLTAIVQQPPTSEIKSASSSPSSDSTSVSSSSITQSNGSYSKLNSHVQKTDQNKLQMQSLSAQIETLRIQYDKLFNDNNEMKAKFQLLEDPPINNQSTNAVDSTNGAVNQPNEQNYDCLLEKINSIKNTYDVSVAQMQSFNDQLAKCKEQINLKDREIVRLKTQLANAVEQTNSATSDKQQHNDTWNKEVRNLDARINDVLGKMKEREMLLNNYDERERKFKEIEKKYELKTAEFNDLNKKYHEVTRENECLKQNLNQLMDEQQLKQHQQQRKISIHDFDDDLGKVLMSKEEVITQLERSLEDKDKQIFKLNDDLQQQTNKYQELVTNESKKSQSKVNDAIEHYATKLNQKDYELEQLNGELQRLNTFIDEQDTKITDLSKTSVDLESKLNAVTENNKNEIDNLQEEIKTLEFKLAHSQKELCDYKNLLNKFDLSSNNDERVQKLEHELNEAKNENTYLNDHIWSLDEFIRDKESQNDLFEDEIKELKCLNQTLADDKQYFEHELKKTFMFNYFNNNKNETIKEFCQRLNLLASYLGRKHGAKLVNEFDFNGDQNVVNVFERVLTDNEGQIAEQHGQRVNMKKFKKYINELKKSIKCLEKFYLVDICKYNQHVLTYITEQIVHKATLNGHLKFACELMRKKCTDSLILIPNVPSIAASGLGNSAVMTQATPVSVEAVFAANSNNSQLSAANLSHDEKICKIASELLLCDEDSLRKLSGQVINEAQHLNQLSCVVHALKKIRMKQFTTINQAFLNKINTDSFDFIDEDDNDTSNDASGTESESNEDTDDENTLTSADRHSDQILDTISEIYSQHKVHVCEQLTEVHKLMSISSDDELFTHLQNENTRLQQEITNLKSAAANNSMKSSLSSVSNPTTSVQSLSQYSPSKFSSNSSPQLKTSDNNLNKATTTTAKFGQILTSNLLKNNILAQDDTLC